MTALFQLDWQGGWSERRLRRRRPGIDDLPWGTLDVAAASAAELIEARRVWTNGVFTEYASAAAFGNLATALLEAGAPVDLSAVAAIVERVRTTVAGRVGMGGSFADQDDVHPRPLTTAREKRSRAAPAAQARPAALRQAGRSLQRVHHACTCGWAANSALAGVAIRYSMYGRKPMSAMVKVSPAR